MNKPFPTLTSKVDEKVVKVIAHRDEISDMLGIDDAFFTCEYTANTDNLPPYDESNATYKKYEEAELKASSFINKDIDVPRDLREYLLSTKKEREEWHRYCDTHYREPKGKFSEEDLLKLFD